jgi:polar amino acid transport system substrate-binding protein
MGILAGVSLGLAGCIGPNKEGTIALPSATITPPDIVEEKVLRVGVDSSQAPFAGLSDGQIVGIDVDIAAALAEKTGLSLAIIDIKDQEPAALLIDGVIDVAMGIKGDAVASFSETQVGPYLIDGPAVFTVGLSDESQGFDPAQLNGMAIVAQEGSLAAWQVGKDYGDGNLRTFPSLNGAFDELTTGSVSYAAADAIVGSFLAIQEYDSVRCEGMLADPQGVYLGVAASKQGLATKLTDALRALRDEGNLQVIVAKWLGPISARTVLSTQAVVALSTTDPGAANATNATNATNAAADTGVADSVDAEGAAAETVDTEGVAAETDGATDVTDG